MLLTLHCIVLQENIKDWNGGDAKIIGRNLYQAQPHEFRFITKTVLACNKGNFPHFSVEDQALVERLVTIPHRSRFYREEVAKEPFSYKADTSIKSMFPKWRPYFLRWCLAGLQRYHQVRFTQIPDSCKQFKNDIVAEKDYVTEFLDITVAEGSSKDFVHIADLYKDFNMLYKDIQRDKKSKKGPKVFKERVIQVLSRGMYKEVYGHKKPTGGSTTVRSVILGYRKVDEQELQ